MFKILLLWCTVFFTADNVRQNYIQNYKDLAIVEMNRTGIPASIKLAQAILESSSGTSVFATSSNNHFGIKCKTYWKGDKYYHKDDDLNDKGELIKSCFRSYATVVDSYIDHSNFITQSPTYSLIFRQENQDYRTWAEGLQYYGYATDPGYAAKLISIIEANELYVFDK